jgi:hypothetical protein
MNQQITIPDVDALLLPFLCAKDEVESENLLAHLLHEHVEPVINKIVRSKLRVPLSQAEGSERNQDALEIVGDLRITILSELRRLKNRSDGRASVNNLSQYVAIKTHSACADYFREKNPQRWRLKNSLRHHLRRNPDFALWQSEGHRWLCGLSSWREAKLHDHSPDSLQELLENPKSALPASSPDADFQLMPLAELLTAVFERASRPVELDQLVAIVGQVKGIKDQPAESFDDEDSFLHGSLVDTGMRVDVAFEQRLALTNLWEEVCALPRLQRAALLLNLRDAQSGSVIAFIPYLKIAAKEQIAEMLSLPQAQFAELWRELPLDDLSIAELLGVTRQQVINLRKTARERLARRMRAREGNL